jgi:hypothetical protein
MEPLDISSGMWMVDELVDVFANYTSILFWKSQDEILCTIFYPDMHDKLRL